MIPEPDTILLVEDNPDDVDLTLRAFRKSNFRNPIVVARDGVEALERLFGTGEREAHPGPRFALVLLDIKMPRMNGLELLRDLRSREGTKRLPVVILTSSKEESDLREAYDLGVNSYIRKPVDFAQFSEAVRQLGLYWLVLNETPPSGGNR